MEAAARRPPYKAVSSEVRRSAYETVEGSKALEIRFWVGRRRFKFIDQIRCMLYLLLHTRPATSRPLVELSSGIGRNYFGC